MSTPSENKTEPIVSTTRVQSGPNNISTKTEHPLNLSSAVTKKEKEEENIKINTKRQMEIIYNIDDSQSSVISLQPFPAKNVKIQPKKLYLQQPKNQPKLAYEIVQSQQSQQQPFNPFIYEENLTQTIDQSLQQQLRLQQQDEYRERRQKQIQQAIRTGKPIPGTQDKRRVRKIRTRMTVPKLQYIQEYFFKYDKHFIEGHRKGNNLTRLAYETGCSKSTIYKLYKNFCLDNTLTQQYVIVRDEAKKAVNQQMLQRRITKLKQILQENPFMTQGQMTQHLKKDQYTCGNGRGLHRSDISRLLKTIKYSKKKVIPIPKYRNVPQNIEKRYKYCAFYKQIRSKDKYCPIFLDQSGFNFFSIRDTAWSSVGKPIQTKVQFPKGTNVSIMAIMSLRGIIAWEIKKGNFKREQNLNFVQKYISRAVRQENHRKQYLIMDNCKIHDPQQTKIIAQNSGVVEVVYLPPYSPQLNPIEHWFHELKCNVRKTHFTTEEQLMNEVNNVVKRYRDYDFSNYFNSVDNHCERGLRRQNF